MSELPLDWKEVAFDELNDFSSKTVNPSIFPDELFELYSVPVFPTGKPEFLKGEDIGSTKQLVNPGDVLVCKINPRINRVWVVGQKTDKRQIASSEWIVMRAAGHDPRFLRGYFSSPEFRELLCMDLTGVGGSLTRAQPKRVAMLGVPIAPLPEQKRIADKLDALLACVDAARTRLDRIPGLLKRFRQSVLAAATSGELTEDWRGTGHIKWRNVKLSQIGEFGRGKSKHRPRNDARLFGGPYPFIQTGDVASSGGIITTHSQTYTVFGLGQSKLWPSGTLCITIAANIADTAILSYPACFPDSVVGFVADKKICIPQYVKWTIDVIKSDLESFAPATAQKNINLGILSELEFELPSLKEQREIVRRVESLFAIADKVKDQYDAAHAQVEKLAPALLAKAFRGELVPQDPTDESAEQLLARIRADANSTTLSKPRRGTKVHVKHQSVDRHERT